MTQQPNVINLPATLEIATNLVERTMPNLEYRKSALKIFSKAINLMNSRNPNCWSINFGRNGPYLLIEHEVAMYCIGSTNELEIHVYLQNADPSLIDYLSKETKLKIDKDDLWSLLTIHLPEQMKLFEQIWPLSQRYIEDKTRYNIHPTSIPPHLKKGAGLVEYMRLNNIDPTLSQPGYVSNPRGRTINHPHQPIDPSINLNLSNLVNSFASEGLSFTPWQIATFYTALQTKGFVILSGVSGMGKTKLAQAFARMLPQPQLRTFIPDDLIKIVIQPYMLKYSRIVIPKSSVEFFTPPEAEESVQVKVTFSDQSEVCMLKHYRYSNTDYIQLYLKAKTKKWVDENFPVNETIVLEPELNENDKIIGFRLGKVKDFAEKRQINSNGNPDNYLFLSVRPDWRDSKSLLGYFNPIDQQYNSTPFLEFIKKACESYLQKEPLVWFVLLDEMNLARVEYYFSDLLSVLESGRDRDGWSREPIRLEFPAGFENAQYEREIRLPPNLYFIGTVNVDETTHSFSPKVLDRAFTIELSDADFSDYPVHLDNPVSGLNDNQRDFLLENFIRHGKYGQIEKSEIFALLNNDDDLRQQLNTLNLRLKPYDLHFGYRVVDEIAEFLVNADQSGFFDDLEVEDDPLDAAVLMKVLPKFHGSRTKLEDPLKEVLAWCLDPREPKNDQIEEIIQDGSVSVKGVIQTLQNQPYKYPRTADRVIRMIRSLYVTGFASFG